MDFAGKVVVATAAGSGIGKAVVAEFARRGATVVVSDFDKAAAETVAAEIVHEGGTAVGQHCDVTSDAHVQALADFAFDRFGRVDVLMNHAGAAAAGPVQSIPLDDWRWVFEVNILGPVRGLRSFLPRMAKQGEGLIINTSSSLALFPEVSVALPYITTKAGVLGLSQGLSLYCRPLGIRVMVLVPDITRTGFHYSGRVTGISPEQAGSLLPLDNEQEPVDVSNELFRAIEEGRFLACNVPDIDLHLREIAADGLQSEYRAYPAVEAPLSAFIKGL